MLGHTLVAYASRKIIQGSKDVGLSTLFHSRREETWAAGKDVGIYPSKKNVENVGDDRISEKCDDAGRGIIGVFW